jgi:hypothetical protein
MGSEWMKTFTIDDYILYRSSNLQMTWFDQLFTCEIVYDTCNELLYSLEKGIEP